MAAAEHQFESLRRSAACAPLSRESVDELLALAGSLIEERRQMRAVLGRLPGSVADLRAALNELAKLLR